MTPVSLPVVVLVDDDEAFLMSLATGLKALRVEVELQLAAGGRQAIALLRERSVSVLVTDLHMPNVDGWAVLEIAHAMHPRPSIIVLTADISTETTERLAVFEPLAILDKPVDLGEVAALIRAAQDGRIATRADEPGPGKPSNAALSSPGSPTSTRLPEEEQRGAARLDRALSITMRCRRRLLAAPVGATLAPRRHRW